MLEKIKEAIDKINKLSKEKPITVISHNDTDGITSAAIFTRALQRWKKPFSLRIVKNLETKLIESLPNDQILIFLDLGSGSISQLNKKQTEIFIFDHHEISNPEELTENITIVNPILEKHPNICAAAISYLAAKTISQENSDLSHLAVIGMVGDIHDKNPNKTYQEIINEAEVTTKKGLLLYPATRPLNRVLENSFSIYIPGVTGNFKGTLELLREAGIQKTAKGYKSISELTDEEMSLLTTSILLKNIGEKTNEDLIGNIYLIKFFNRMEDARELSALINACSRMDRHEVCLGFCLGNKQMKKEANSIYTKYRKSISSALQQIEQIEKISGKDYVIINSKETIKDTIIGTALSMISFSSIYSKGTILIGMAHTSDSTKIKVSARIAGRTGKNVRKILIKAAQHLTKEIGGHPFAAGCLIDKEKEDEFVDNLKNVLDIDLVKAQ
jgi:single-stranded-DNA-specific exonuclease